MAEEIRRVHGIDRRKLLIGGALAACSGVTLARQPRDKIDYLGEAKLEAIIPTRVGSYNFLSKSGLVVPPEDPLSDALYSQLLTRVYVDGRNPPIMLLIAQSAGQTGLLQVHRPEFCYPAGGYELSPIVQQPVPVGDGRSIPVNRLTATSPERVEQILYWTRVGNDLPVTWAQQRMAIAMANLRGQVPDAVLIRVSTIDIEQAPAFARLTEFLERLLDSLKPAARRVLVNA